PVPIVGDAGQLKQVFVNIVWNAIDAMEGCMDARLDVRLTVHGGVATLSCADRGVGISEDAILRIFDPFFTTKAPARGTGLGLAMCMAIVKQHGGAIRVSSTPGLGTTFHIALPIKVAETDASAGRAAHPSSSLLLAGSRVLVVDD